MTLRKSKAAAYALADGPISVVKKPARLSTHQREPERLAGQEKGLGGVLHHVNMLHHSKQTVGREKCHRKKIIAATQEENINKIEEISKTSAEISRVAKQ